MSTYENAYVAELPAAYFDAFTLAASLPSLALVNRVPEPDETGVPLDELIMLHLVGKPGSGGSDYFDMRVYVDGVLAVDGSLYDGLSWSTIFLPGFNGPYSTFDYSNTLDQVLTIDATAPFASEQVVQVRVVAELSDNSAAIDETYSFTCADFTAPALVSAQAIGLQTVRVSFAEAVTAASSAGSDDALNPANYVLAPLTAPAVTPTVTSVEQVSSEVFDLVTDIELSIGQTYNVTVANVEDGSGNAVEPPFNQLSFVAFTPAVPAGRNFNLYRMLPLMNRREDAAGTGDLLKFISCLQDVVNLQLFEIDDFVRIFDTDTADEEWVDLMLADMGNPFAFEDLTLNRKRALLRVLADVYAQKGTAPGIVNVVRFFLGIEVEVIPFTAFGMTLGEAELGVDWELGIGTSFARYAFDVESPVVLTDEQRAQIRDLVDYMKPAHTHFVTLIEPTPPDVIDHLEVGLSELGVDWDLH